MATIFDADNPNGQNQQNNQNADQNNQNNQNTNQNQQTTRRRQRQNTSDYESYLKSIDATLKELLRYTSNASQSNARIFRDDLRNRRTQEDSRNTNNRNNRNNNQNERNGNAPQNRQMGSFSSELRRSIMSDILGSGYEEEFRNVFSNMAKEMGVSIEDLPGAFGKEFGGQILRVAKDTRLGRSVEQFTKNAVRNAEERLLKNAFNKGYNDFLKKQDPNAEVVDAYETILKRQMDLEQERQRRQQQQPNPSENPQRSSDFEPRTRQESQDQRAQQAAENARQSAEEAAQASRRAEEAARASRPEPANEETEVPRREEPTRRAEEPMRRQAREEQQGINRQDLNLHTEQQNELVIDYTAAFQSVVRPLEHIQASVDEIIVLLEIAQNIEDAQEAKFLQALQVNKKDYSSGEVDYNTFLQQQTELTRKFNEERHQQRVAQNELERRDTDHTPDEYNPEQTQQRWANRKELVTRSEDESDQTEETSLTSDISGFNASDFVNNLPSNRNELKDVSKSLENFSTGLQSATSGSSGFGNILDSLTGSAGAASAGASAMASGALGVVKSLGKMGAATLLFDTVVSAVADYVAGPLISGFKTLVSGFSDVLTRSEKEQEAFIQNEQDRIRADVETLVREPFEILRDAAQEWYDFWDNQMHTINQTQGYDKAQLQDLMSSYAQRLKDEGLTSVVSSADIGESLAKVIQAGLTGAAAEEFAYQATKLGAAVPTQDFFSYADQYAQLVASAQMAGKTQEDAIAYATEQLEEFASSVIYSSRATGGFAAGLKDTSALFSDAIAIAQSARTGDVSEIAGVLTSIAGTVGSIAPELSSGLVDAVVKAATGGNASELVALRSLAGVNASNTEFLKELATDAQGLFVTIFRNLSQYQNMAPEAYMEVAEGLSSIFGISQEAFARVDFNYLADQIAAMNVNTNSLQENLDLLASGQSTTTTEQLRMRQINQYMIEEGLSYVLDNEAARAIQEHMWQEQIADRITQSEFAVNLKGKALEFIQKISNAVNHIATLLNPKKWFQKAEDVIDVSDLIEAQDNDLLQMLELGKVGQGNAQELYNLVTRGKKLDLIDPLVELMGGTSESTAIQDKLDAKTEKEMQAADVYGTDSALGEAVNSAVGSALNSALGNFSTRTLYTWGSITKSQAAAAATVTSGLSAVAGKIQAENDEREEERQALADAVNRMIDPSYMYGKFAKEGKSYEDWVRSATKFGITDWDAALEAAGISEADLINQYGEYETQEGSQILAADFEDQWNFRQDAREFFDTQIEKDDIIISDLDKIIENQVYFIESWKDFLNVWLREVILHETYNASYDYNKVLEVQKKEKAGPYDAITALAESLASNMTDLKDPQVQTNAILAKILLSVIAIEEENKKETTASNFVDSLIGLSQGQ